MNSRLLEDTLRSALIQIQPIQPHYSTLFEDDGVTPKKFLPGWLVNPIKEAIDKIPELQGLLLRTIGTHSTRSVIQSWHIAQMIAYRLFSSATPEQIASDMLDFASRNTCEVLTYVGCYSGDRIEPFALGEGVSVMSAEFAPSSQAREMIFGINRWGNPIVDFGLPNWKPNIAIVISEQAELFRDENSNNLDKLASLSEKIERSARALTLSSPHPFVRSWQMDRILHPAVPYEGIGGWGAQGTLEGIPKPRQVKATPIDVITAQSVFKKLESLPSRVKISVNLAIDRLGRSRTHAPSADTALDLGISSEIILLNDSPDSEIKYRYSTRGAYLIGADENDRIAKYEAFRAFYNARSKAVHTGTLDSKGQNRLLEFDTLCATIIRRIVEDQNFPDWEKLVLGVGLNREPRQDSV